MSKLGGWKPDQANHAAGRNKQPFARSWSPAFNVDQLYTAPIAPQYKLEIGAADDAYEREADAVADAVVNGGELEGDLSGGAAGIQRACTTCESEEDLRRSPHDGAGPTPQLQPDTSAEISSARASGGQALPGSARSYFEPRFNADFSDIRIHRDAQAASLSHGLGARAFTVGRDLFFGAGQLNYSSHRGRHLLAHELTHTIQQSGAVRRKPNE
ncbi:eCIS core domain-containing protein [Enhygromyxa salina]|uniref:eCIS core domain-containing protein n=1 Tax=Enhygromyxa salina TaxID=215803 RepID=UPI0015E7B5AD|nr:DUF4157 domain-containing protein [Enhygromyxa salina]